MTPVSKLTEATPLLTTAAAKSKCGVAPRIIAPRAMMPSQTPTRERRCAVKWEFPRSRDAYHGESVPRT